MVVAEWMVCTIVSFQKRGEGKYLCLAENECGNPVFDN